ncbi:MAG: hypothetical protein EBV73_05055 [Rhodocyclales bacterium]|nr:hypothetical protein [Rhodocyclales bacterium]
MIHLLSWPVQKEMTRIQASGDREGGQKVSSAAQRENSGGSAPGEALDSGAFVQRPSQWASSEDRLQVFFFRIEPTCIVECGERAGGLPHQDLNKPGEIICVASAPETRTCGTGRGVLAGSY